MEKKISAWEEYKQKKETQKSLPWHILNKNKKIEENLAENRFNICKECPEFIKITSQCKKCGCFMNIKTKLEAAKCPINKW